MRVDRYELVNFGSHRHTVFEPGDAGLCIIQGENGVGKTTLASEALGHALYKDDRGSVNAGVRNGETDSAVSIDFAFGGARYRAIRRRTTKGAGKSSSDLQVQSADGAWTPLASGDKEVPAAVRELLRMDAATFRTSVSLAQKDLDRFVAATARGRHEILAAIVVDPRFKPAAELAGRRARDLEATSAGDRSHLQRTSDAIAELEPVRAILAARRDERAAVAGELAGCREALRSTEETLRDREAQMAAASAHAGDIARVEAEVASLVERYTRTRDRRAASVSASRVATSTITGAAEVDTAVTMLDALHWELESALEAERQDRVLAIALEAKRAEVAELRWPYDQELATWTAQTASARERVEGLEAAAKALKPVVCEKCRHPNVVDQADVRGQLRTSRERLHELEAAEPRETIRIQRAEALVTRAEIDRRALAFDPAAMIELQRRVRETQALAARSETIAAARATLEREQAAIAEADVDLNNISAAGVAARARLEELNAAAAGLERIGRERDAAMSEATRVRASIEGSEVRTRELEAQIARAEQSVERLDGLIADRDRLADALATTDVDLGRLRKMAAAFGLKGIPARVIETVLPELGRHANEVLGELFGLTLDIRATRASADGRSTIEELDLVVRKDGIGEIEDERLSGGEGTAVSLALAIGLSRLNARRAGSAIRTMVLDEPDGLDTVRLQALGKYLRRLVHEGEHERIVAITHTETLAEFGDRVDRVVDGPDGVVLERIA